MKIGAIQKTSLQDFPGKVSAIVGTQGCNMRCPWCHNAQLIPYEIANPTDTIPEAEIFSFLDQRKHLLGGVVITGGEPTIQSDLPAFCEQIKQMDLAVKIDTNGTHPDVLDSLIKEALVDYIAMDIKTDLDQYPRLFREKIETSAILESIDLLMASETPYEFRATCVSPFVTTDNMHEIGMLIKGAERLYLQKCNPPEDVDHIVHYAIIDEPGIAELCQIANAYAKHGEIR